MKRKSQKWVKTWASPQSPFSKLIFCNSGQKLRKKRYQTFLVKFSNWSYSLQNILYLIVDRQVGSFYVHTKIQKIVAATPMQKDMVTKTAQKGCKDLP